MAASDGSRPLIAIVGRPNVGKSTLFNRLAGFNRAIVENAPGVTRDRHYSEASFDDRPVILVDTGGFTTGEEKDPVLGSVRQQAQLAIEEADLVLFVVDAKTGALPIDAELGGLLRRSERPVIVVANKIDRPGDIDAMAAEFFKLGLGTPMGTSAEHGLGIQTLKEAVVKRLKLKRPSVVAERKRSSIPRVAIVGRPNVGKSTLVNTLLKENRMVVSPIAGTTRDPIDSELTVNGAPVILTDTAGIRRKSTISLRVEQFSVVSALKTLDRADVALVMLDANEAGVDQDLRIAAIAEEKGIPLLIVVNKWDTLFKTVKEREFREELKARFRFVSYAPIVFVSATDKIGTDKLIPLALSLHEEAGRRVPTPLLNRLLERMINDHPLPFHNGKALKIYFCAQVGSFPPAFAFVSSRAAAIPERYRRYVTNTIRESFSYRVPMRVFFKDKAKDPNRQAPPSKRGPSRQAQRARRTR